MKELKIRLFVFLIAGGLIFASMCSCTTDTVKYKYTQIIDTPIVIQKDTFAITQMILYKMLCENKVKHPEIVLKQAVLETGHFESNYCKEYYNLFGFMTSNGCKQFDSYLGCVQYYKRWQDSYYISYKYRNYYDFLDSIGYAEDTTYIDKLKHIKINV